VAWKRRVKHKPTVYAVHWPEINVFKIGYSEQKRWRAFELRGANILALQEFDVFDLAYYFEYLCHRAAWEVCRPAFSSAHKAVPYLGGRGGGYVECCQVPGDLMPWEILPFIDYRLSARASAEHMPEHHAAEQCTYVTDVLTKNYSPLISSLTFRNARGGAAKNG